MIQALTEKAAYWGAWMGQDIASRQWRKRFQYFFPREVKINAENSAHNQAVEYNVPNNMLPEWNQIFVEAYTTSYNAKVEALKAK